MLFLNVICKKGVDIILIQCNKPYARYASKLLLLNKINFITRYSIQRIDGYFHIPLLLWFNEQIQYN